MLLSQIMPGQSAIVLELDEKESNSLRLMEMGIVPGVAVTVIKSAPLGDPLEIRLRGYNLAIRKGDAEKIVVKIAAEVRS